MAALKRVMGLLALLAASGWTEAGVVRRKRSYDSQEGGNVASVAEQLEKANRNLNRNRNSVQINSDIAVPPQPTQRNLDPCSLQGCKWPQDKDGKVYIPYVIANHYFSGELNVIRRAMDSFSNSTCIHFIPVTNQSDYLYIQSLEGCYSYVGRRGKVQIVSLNRGACMYYGIIQHELIHALGFNHEHSRSDRDQYIKILMENVMPGLEQNFKKVNTLNQANSYDYNSIMHYGRLAFSRNYYSPTMVAFPNLNTVFGTATEMSPNDIDRINLLYCSQQ